VSVAGNVGHVTGHSLTARATAAVPPLAAASALAVGLGVLKRVVEHHHQAQDGHRGAGVTQVAQDAEQAAHLALAASIAAGNRLSQRQIMARFGLSRAQAARVREAVTTSANGHPPSDQHSDARPVVPAQRAGMSPRDTAREG